MKIFILLAFALCLCAADVKETDKADVTLNKEKRQTQGEGAPPQYVYRTARKQEQAAPVEEPQDDEKHNSRADAEQYRPGQVFSLNAQELLELQHERQAPLNSNQLLQQLYSNPQPEHKQNLQQVYYLEPQQTGRQVAFQPSRAVIARPDYTSNGGEASVGAALSVSDTGANPSNTYNQDLLALLGHTPVRSEEPREQIYSQPQVQQEQQASTVQSVAPQYQQVERYISKPSKKSKLRNKVQQVAQPQPAAAPQQYLIETTNVQQQQSPLYRTAPQPQRVPQAMRYVQFPQAAFDQQALYERPESQGLKVVAAPNLQQAAAPQNFRFVPQYQPGATPKQYQPEATPKQYQPEATPKQYRIVEAPRQALRQEQRLSASSVDRPVAYSKRFPENEKMRSVKIYDPINAEVFAQQAAQAMAQQYYVRPAYRGNEQRARYEIPTQFKEQAPTNAPQSSIYVSKNLVPRKQARPQPALREQKYEQPNQSNVEQVNIEQHGRSLEEQRAQLPPPKNNKAYTQEEFAALIAAGYAVTPVPVSAISLQEAQSRSAVEALPAQPKRRPLSSRRHQYLPLRGDDAP